MPNPMEMMKLMNMWNTFKSNHPKFPMFLNAASQPGVIGEGAILEMKITTPDGRTMETNLKVQASDMAMIEQLKQLRK